MAIRSGFFNSVNGDRKYDARRFAEYFASFIGNGIFPNPSTNLQVVAQTIPDMTVIVRPGKAWINGYILINDDDYILQLEPADGVLNRIDRVVARYDTADREIRLEVKKGTFASTPVAPALQRDVDAYELALADIYVANGVISITQANITDQRLNSELCGVVHGTVEQVDTTTLFNQYQTWFSETQTGAETDIDDLMGDLQSDWDTWFATVQEVLDGDTAGQLLNLINANTIALEGKADQAELDQVNTDLAEHKADYTSFKTDVGSNVKLLELNFLDLLIARELENLSTEMDTGYWWDTLQDATKIQNVTGATVSGGKIITTAETSEVVWREHDIGFLTNKITYYMNRTKTTDIAPVDVGAVAGEDEITIKAAVITIAEAVS